MWFDFLKNEKHNKNHHCHYQASKSIFTKLIIEQSCDFGVVFVLWTYNDMNTMNLHGLQVGSSSW